MLQEGGGAVCAAARCVPARAGVNWARRRQRRHAFLLGAATRAVNRHEEATAVRKRPWVVAGLVALSFCLSVAAAHLHFARKRPRCDLAAYRAVRKGMTLEQVHAT